jgi:hypothetical protein
MQRYRKRRRTWRSITSLPFFQPRPPATRKSIAMLVKVTDIPRDEAYRLFCTDRRLYTELRSLHGRVRSTDSRPRLRLHRVTGSKD